MKQIKQESPKFEFEELEVTERVADTCWGVKYGWFDIDKDGAIDELERISLEGMGSCKGVERMLADYLNKHYQDVLDRPVTGDDVKTNTHGEYVKPIYS